MVLDPKQYSYLLLVHSTSRNTERTAMQGMESAIRNEMHRSHLKLSRYEEMSVEPLLRRDLSSELSQAVRGLRQTTLTALSLGLGRASLDGTSICKKGIGYVLSSLKSRHLRQVRQGSSVW